MTRTTTTRWAPAAPVARLLPALVLGLVVLAGCGSEDAEPTAGDSAGDTAGDTASSTPSDAATSSASPEPSEPTSEPTTSASPEVPAGTPACGEVWVEDARIPRGYRGCVDDTGAYVRADRLGCSSGQALIRYADRFYGVAGGTVSRTAGPLLDDPDYTETVEGCRA